MAENPASTADLSARSLRVLSNQELLVGEVLLDDAWTIITTSIPRLSARLDAAPLEEGLVSLIVQVECAMVLRVLNNPEGKLQETVDDYTYRLDAARSTGALYISDLELSLLIGGGGASEGAFTIRPSGWRPRHAWWPF